jgi:type II secretory pathway component PulJ
MINFLNPEHSGLPERAFGDSPMLKNIWQKSKSGFSLIETLIAFSVFLLLLDSIWVMYKNTNDTNNILTSGLNTQMEVRRAFALMTANIRSASPSSIGAYTIAAASSTAFIYYSDMNNDGLKERIRYFLSGSILKEGIIEPSGSPLTYNIANEKIYDIIHGLDNGASPAFSYYNKNYDGFTAALAAPINIPDIRLIKINLIIDADPLVGPGAATFTTQVSIRNLKDNL